MNPTVLTTAAIAPKAQVQAWQDWFWPMLEVAPKDSRTSFAAENSVWDLGGLLMSKVSAPPVSVSRKKFNLAKAPVDHWVLTYCRSGATNFRTDRAELHAPAGVPFLWSLGDASESIRDQVDRIQIFMPRDAFQDMASLIDAKRTSTLPPPFGPLLASYIELLERHLPSMSEAEASRLGASTRSLIAASFAPSPDHMKGAESGIMLGKLERVRKVVHANLTSAQLGPAFLAREAGMSRSQLYRLFECYGGVDRYIKSQRLLRAFQLLSDPMQRAPIHAIAADLHFGDASSFSRAFKSEFDCSPMDVRSAAMRGALGSPLSRSKQPTTSSRFSDLFMNG